ncbi:VanW family protein [Bacillus suaedaesalsae]|uniref:VanW family protein n=1 Tax=Bacillus suaedaesalsae TaxID=2810349 RepID=A0ABS2DHF0_9BACI|nr:VanW family protein [Bacillus suaedaesalsae]MBM6617864.1 VanW family protein [Bacillus suaedaesalsae]
MINLFFSLCLLTFSTYNPTNNDDLALKHDGETIATINHDAFTSSLIDIPTINEKMFEQLVTKLEQHINEEPVNAYINEKNVIVSGKPGYQLDREKFKQELYTYFLHHQPLELEIPTVTVHPRVSSELIADIHVKQIGSFVTYYSVHKSERSSNIAIAAEAINNHVVFQGEVFSFNEVVGKRTAEKGYLPAPIIIKGELYDGVGGGICQVSSTLFNAVDEAGVKIVQRYSHSRRVPYVPPGRDATVSWYGPDFTFKNVYNQPILIRASAKYGRLVIQIYSSEVINTN